MYVVRDESGKIVSAFAAAQPFATEYVYRYSPELVAFLEPVPTFLALTPVQFKLGMLYLNLVPAQIDGAISALSEPDRTIAQIYWTSTALFKRDDPILIAIASTFGLTSIQIDEAWKYAETLV
jgi:hypothetical protein